MFNPLSLISAKYKLLAIGIAALIVAGILLGTGYKTGHFIATNHYTAIISDMKEKESTLRAEKAELQTKLTAEIANVKERVITKYVDRVKVITEKEYVYIEQAENNVPSQYDLSNGWVYLHDVAAGNSDADSTRSSDGSPSGIKDSEAIAVVASNYATYHRTAEQLTAMQQYVLEVQQIVKEANEVLKKGKR